MQTIRGIITSKIKLVSSQPILFRFEVTNMNDEKFNLLLHKHALNFFQYANQGSGVELGVEKNSRNQLVVRRFNVFNSHVTV